MSILNLRKSVIYSWIERRRMDSNTLIEPHQLSEGDAVQFISLNEITELAIKLNVKLSDLFKDFEQTDLHGGIKICRNFEGYRRENVKNGCKIYTYQHLVKTHLLPQMMPIRCTVHNNDISNYKLNDGHKYQEMVVVSHSRVRMFWQKDSNEVQHVDLNEGDSLYIAPDVRHCFLALEEHAEILAFNF